MMKSRYNHYLNLLNDTERGPEDQPSIGIILCTEKDDVEVEYALRTKRNPTSSSIWVAMRYSGRCNSPTGKAIPATPSTLLLRLGR
jgi:hypothetical protein